MSRPPFPKTLREFQSNLASEEACQKYLGACRWPDGFLCPRCGGREAYELMKLRRWQCAGCRHQVSLTAGTTQRTRVNIAIEALRAPERGFSQLTVANPVSEWLILIIVDFS